MITSENLLKQDDYYKLKPGNMFVRRIFYCNTSRLIYEVPFQLHVYLPSNTERSNSKNTSAILILSVIFPLNPVLDAIQFSPSKIHEPSKQEHQTSHQNTHVPKYSQQPKASSSPPQTNSAVRANEEQIVHSRIR